MMSALGPAPFTSVTDRLDSAPGSGDAGSAPAGSKAAGGGRYYHTVNNTKVPFGSYTVELV